MQSFYRVVLPQNACYAGSTIHGISKKIVNFFTHDLEYLDYRLAQAALTGHDCYFATAAFDTQADSRKDIFVTSSRTLAHDVDIGKPGGYQSVTDARKGLSQLVRDKKIPRPSRVVASGGGLHLYWAHVDQLDPQSKRDLANTLALAMRHDPLLCVDMSATTKIAPLLRWPGTYNWKTGQPRAVDVCYEGPQYTSDALRKAFGVGSVAPLKRAPAPITDKLVVNPSAMLPVKGATIDTGCVALAHWKAELQHKPETFHVWSPLMHMTGWLDDPAYWAKRWSEGPQADLPRAVELATKAVQAKNNNTLGPTSCAKLLEVMALDKLTACATCPLRDRQSSPVFLEAALSKQPGTLVKQPGKIKPRTITLAKQKPKVSFPLPDVETPKAWTATVNGVSALRLAKIGDDV